MNVSMNYSTRKLIVLNQIRGYNEEHLIDNIEFTIPVELTGFNILLTFVQGDDTPIGAVTLATPWTSGTIDYVVPIALTIYNHIKYQVVAAHPTTQAVWKSNIGHIYFDEPLPDHGDIPFTELSPYPDWVTAIEATNEALLAVTGAIEATNAAIVEIQNVEAAIIANEATRQQIYNDLLSVNGLVYVGNGAIRTAVKEDINADTLDGYHAFELGLAAYIHNQIFYSNVWNVNHNRNSYPSVTIIDDTNNVIYGSIEYIDLNNLQITFSESIIGKAYII